MNFCGKAELLGIVKTSETPTIDNSWFPNTPLNSVYWTSSPVAGEDLGAWDVDFINGVAGADVRTGEGGYYNYRVR